MCLYAKMFAAPLKFGESRKSGAVFALILAAFWLGSGGQVLAHAAELGLVLLLPTKVYIASGCMAVILSLLIVGGLPARYLQALFVPRQVPVFAPPRWFRGVCSLVSLGVLVALLLLGWLGVHDPLANLLPLMFWTIWWVAFVVLQGFAGDIWGWINPWTGLHRLVFRTPDKAPLLRLPDWLGTWPAILIFICFSAFSIAHPAPDDPELLAAVVSGYWVFTFAGMVIFGREIWLSRCECFTVLLRLVARLAPLQWAKPAGLALPGWSLLRHATPSASLAVFILVLLGCGSFDGLNETFWWLGTIGVNPLEFPGRSAIIPQTIAGLLATNILLVTAFAGCIWLGLRLAGPGRQQGEMVGFSLAFCRLSLSVLPIAFGYHAAHYLTSLLVNGQYAIAAIYDLLGLGQFHVTTGFFNTLASVRLIWLTQAGIVVGVHMLAVLMAHSIASGLFGSSRRAILSQIPLGIFMVLYTFLGLWLLASARGA